MNMITAAKFNCMAAMQGAHLFCSFYRTT